MGVDKIARMLQRRPAAGRFREQLFWLVDVVYACKASSDAQLREQAQLVEDALGRMGEFLETGDSVALDEATACVEQFARFVKKAVSAAEANKE